MGAVSGLAERVEQQRRRVVRHLLWALGGFVVLILGWNAAQMGPALLTHPALLPNLGVLAVVVVALLLNRSGRFAAAVGVVMVLTLGAATVPIWMVGLHGSVASVLMFVVPIVLAGLVLERRDLWWATAWAVVALVAAAGMHATGRLLGGPVSARAGWELALDASVLLVLVAYVFDRFGLVFREALTDALSTEERLREAAEARVLAQAQRLEAQRLTEVVVENLPGLFVVADRHGRLVRWNRNVERTLGFAAEELRGAALPLVGASGAAGADEDVAALFRRVADAGGGAAELHLRTRDGARLPYLVSATRLVIGGEDHVASLALDRSEIAAARGRIEALDGALRERLERMSALHEIDRAITGSLDLRVTLDVVLRQVTERLDVDAAAVLLVDEAAQTLVHGAGRGFRSSALRHASVRVGEGLAGHVALVREPVEVAGAEELARTFVRAPAIVSEGFAHYIAVPLVSKGRLQGVLELFHRGPLAPDDDWYGFLTALATQAAIAVDNAGLVTRLERSNAELRLAYDRTIEGWARALDLRDEETEGHSRRVTDLTVRLADRLGIDRETLVHVRRGALLHDIGKMGVPDRILLKPGPLDDAEWAVMRQHPAYAVELLNPIEFLRPALDIPEFHHEKWDGSGYPHGLEGTDIPLAARAFAVVDVWDALTSDRPYRRAWSHERARAYLLEQRGKHFDPEAVDAFLTLLDDG